MPLDDLARRLKRPLDGRVLWAVSLLEDRIGRRQATLHDRLDDLDRRSRELLAAFGWREEAGGPAPAELTPSQAAWLNWATGPDGYAAQAGLWSNPPLPVEHVAGGVVPLLVNERVVEQPWVFAQVGTAPRTVLDVGGSESTVALSLATLGHRVTVVDPRGFPVGHPNLHVVASRLDELEPDPAGYDVVLALSSIEHFGLEHYGLEGRAGDEDREAARQLAGLVAPGGRLLLTVPLAPEARVQGFERLYDDAALAALLDGWEVVTRTDVWRQDRLTWSASGPPSDRGVALVAARPRR